MINTIYAIFADSPASPRKPTRPRRKAPRVEHAADALRRKREAIWGCPRRNDLITRLALGAVKQDLAALWELGIPPGEWEEAYGEIMSPNVSVLVESTAHGTALLKLLDGWELLTANGPPPVRFGRSRRRR